MSNSLVRSAVDIASRYQRLCSLLEGGISSAFFDFSKNAKEPVISVKRDIRDGDANSSSSYAQHYSSFDTPSFVVPQDSVITTSVSPSTKYTAIFRKDGTNSDPSAKLKVILEVWSGTKRLSQTVVDKTHSSVLVDGWFGAITWSSDESHIVYVAEEGVDTKKSHYESLKPSLGENTADESKVQDSTPKKFGDQFTFREDWGEKYVGTATPRLFLWNWSKKVVKSISTSSELAVGQPVFGPNGWLLYTGWTIGSRRLGSIYCYQRLCSIYATDISSLLEDGETKTTASSSKHFLLTTGPISRSARFNPAKTAFAYLAMDNVSLHTHNSQSRLHIYDFSQWLQLLGSNSSHITKEEQTSLDRVCVHEVWKAPFPTPNASTSSHNESLTNSNMKPIIRNEDNEWFPGLFLHGLSRNCWSPDGKSLFLLNQAGMGTEVMQIEVSSGRWRILRFPQNIFFSRFPRALPVDMDPQFRGPRVPATVSILDMKFQPDSSVEGKDESYSWHVLLSLSTPSVPLQTLWARFDGLSGDDSFMWDLSTPSFAEFIQDDLAENLQQLWEKKSSPSMKENSNSADEVWNSLPLASISRLRWAHLWLQPGAMLSSPTESPPIAFADDETRARTLDAIVKDLSVDGVDQPRKCPQVDQETLLRTDDIPFDAIVVWTELSDSDSGSVQGRPLLIQSHGGPHSAWGAQFLQSTALFAAVSPFHKVNDGESVGAAVLMTNYRGSTGYSQASIASLPGHCGLFDVNDTMQAALTVLGLCGVQSVVQSDTTPALGSPVSDMSSSSPLRLPSGYFSSGEGAKNAFRGLQLDSTRVLLQGGSHGGFLTAMLLGQQRTQWLFKGGCLRNPVTSFIPLSATSDIPDWTWNESLGLGGFPVGVPSPLSVVSTNEEEEKSSKGVNPKVVIYQLGSNGLELATPYQIRRYPLLGPKDALKMLQASPQSFVNNINLNHKVLLMLGNKDRRVHPTQGFDYFYALKSVLQAQIEEKNPSASVEDFLKLYVYPEDVHALDKPATEADCMINMVHFFANL